MDDELILVVASVFTCFVAFLLRKKYRSMWVNPYLRQRHKKGRYAVDVSVIYVRVVLFAIS